MIGFPLLAAAFFISVMAVLFVICAVALVLAVLIQKGKGGGLSGAFGGGAMSGILGSQSKGPLTWFTIGLAGLFLLLAVVMAKFYKPTVRDLGPAQDVRREQPTGSEQPSPIGDTGTATSDESSDANLPGG